MGNGEPRPQRCAVAAIEEEKLVGRSIMQRPHDAAPQVFARPGGAEPLAFHAKEGNLVDRIDDA